MATARRVLVILRAGDQSLHPEWFTNAPSERRNWDLHLSYFGDLRRPFRNRYPDITLSFEKGTKSVGTVACLEKLGSRLDEYDWVWLPDDDLWADLPTLNRFFEIVAEYDLDLAQPALGAGSYAAYHITAQRPHMCLRFTTFVEVMAPCFSRKALRLCAPYLGATRSSWGINWMFPKLLGYPQRGIAIVDETPVVHTRPHGHGPNIALTHQAGFAPQQEMTDFMKLHQLEKRLETWGGIDLAGQFVSDPAEIDSEVVMVR
ncbi:DUF707 domain-containing protein [Taklimakanibacter lacteus]|uniref:DUF707 domain-containing protein n=1 Tax=Taklimakanibacter lacteus TaxID=2268456 RepID=UPI000E65EC81